MDTQMSLEVKTLLPKKNSKEIAKIIYRKFNNLKGVYYATTTYERATA